jgi:hypothetical protein
MMNLLGLDRILPSLRGAGNLKGVAGFVSLRTAAEREEV